MKKNLIKVQFNQFIQCWQVATLVISWVRISPLFNSKEDAEDYANQWVANHPCYELWS